MYCGCAICQDLFHSEIGIVSTTCGHVFHNICLDQWLERSGTCPECRHNVRKSSLIKIFFNTSFDETSGKIEGRSLDTLKELLRTKEMKIKDKDKKIEELQNYCARSEGDVARMHQELLELKNQLSAIKRELQNLSRVETKNQKLVEENNILKNQLEHLNNVKTIVEGCCNDAKKILEDVQVSSSEGKVASHRIATYCSVIKRELACSVEEKTLLQNELTKVKRKMGILQANYAKKLTQLERQVKRLSLSQSAPSGLSPIPVPFKNNSLHCNNLTESTSVSLCNPNSENHVTPITCDFPENKRQKMNIIVLDREIGKFSNQMPETPILRLTNSTLPARQNPENDSVSRLGYNGLGGHGRIVIGSGMKRAKRKPLRKQLT